MPQKSSSNIITKAIWLILLFILAYFLWMEHRAHVVEYLPTILFFSFLLLCPLMHLFMHHGHSHDEKKHEDDSKDNENR